MSDRAAAVRHLVYSELLSILPPASLRQTLQFVSNLAMQRPAFEAATVRERDRIIDRIVNRFCYLKVSPDIAETDAGKVISRRSRREIEATLQERFGGRLKDVAGFYFEGRWKINLPEGCALHGYRGQHGFYTGVLCQPLNRVDFYFLLSSAMHGGEKAIRLERADLQLFRQWEEPAELRHGLIPPQDQASLDGWKWTGRRFREPSPTQ